MKKLFAVLALVAVMTSCKSKKKDEKKPDETTTTTTTTTTTDATTTAASGVPTFSDPEIQKFANDYGAFVQQYKAGMKDPAKLAELAKTMQDWSGRASSIGMKLATNPGEAKAWADWMMACAKEMMPSMK
jgi:PBP1b-binding outer membrane lipoprotein LpoB